MSNQLIVIDPSVANYQSLIDQLGASYSYLLLSLDSDGVTQIANFVAENPGFDAIHLISHGSPGQVVVGTSTFSEATLGGYTAQLNQIGASLNSGGDFLIYGCDVAQGGVGQQLIAGLSRLTRLDVAASTNRTGGTGDWVLEVATGSIVNSLPAIRFFGDLVDIVNMGGTPTVGWTRLIGSTSSDLAKALTTGLDGSVYVAGYTSSSALDGQTNAGAQDAFITKFASDGTKVWTKLIGSTSGDLANALTTGLDGSVYVAGDTSSRALDGQTNALSNDAFITKFASDGTKVWTKLIGSTYSDLAYALTTGLDGSVYVAGYTGTALDGQTNAGSNDAFITKFASDGTKVWTKLIGSTFTDQGYALTTGLDGSVYVAGLTYSRALDGQTNAGSNDAFITKFASDGTKVWTKLIGSTGSDEGYALTTGLDGSVYVAGYTLSSALDGQTNAGNSDAFITKFASDGTKVWTKLIGSTGSDEGYALTTGLDGSVYVAGYTLSSALDGQTNAGNSDAFITKFASDGTKVWTKLIGSTGSDEGYALTTGLDGSVYVAGYTLSSALDGQTNAGNSDAFVIKLLDDSIPPTIAITSNKSSLGSNQTATLTFTLSEAATDFDASDLTVAGGTLSNFTGSSTSYSATFTPNANSTTPGVVSVASNKFSDAAGNFNVDGSDGNNTVTIAVDTRVGDIIPPTVSVSSDQTTLLTGQTANLAFTLSEPSTNFGAGDVEVSGGSLSNFAGSGASYTATFTPATNKRETAKVSVGSGTFSDAAGNTNVDGNDGDNTVLLTIDTMVNRAPTASGATVSGLQDAMVAVSAAAIGFRDADKGDVLRSITITTLPAKGSLLLGGSAVSVGQVISADDINGGSLAFKGAAMQSGLGYASFGFKVNDGRTLSAADAKITFNLKAVNYAPVVANPIADQQVSEGQAFTLKLPSNTFTDLESPVLSYSATQSSGKPLPKWLKFDAKTATLSGTPSELDAGVSSISVKATDAGKASVADTFDLTVLDINRAPIAKAIKATPSATEGKAFAFVVPKTTFVDPDRGDVLTYSLSNAPAWLTIDSETGKLNGTLNYAAADTATITVTLQATDKQSLSASTPLTIKLVNVSKIVGTADSNTLIAGAGADSISGLAGNDALNGGAGNDTLVGGLGDDQLTGGDGQDRFVFESPIKNGGNLDTVTDFLSGIDTIALAGSVFTALRGDTDLSDSLWLTTSTSPATARSYLVFDPQSGALSFDSDGSGPATSIAICALVGVTKLGPGDLLMI